MDVFKTALGLLLNVTMLIQAWLPILLLVGSIWWLYRQFGETRAQKWERRAKVWYGPTFQLLASDGRAIAQTATAPFRRRQATRLASEHLDDELRQLLGGTE